MRFIYGLIIGIIVAYGAQSADQMILPEAISIDEYLASDHSKHERAIAELENMLYACEDAWQADMAECQMNSEIRIVELQETLWKCEGYLEMCGE